MNFEKLESRIICLILISLIYLPLSSQDKVFTLQSNADNRIVINKDVSGNIQLSPFKSDRSISGLTISCDITFNSDSSLVRIILVDEDYNEYLICEAYPLLNESNTFSLNDFAEETSYLLNIIPQMIEIEVVDASVFLKEITTRKEEKLITKATMDRSWQQNSEKIKRINENLKKKGGLWVAGETSVSKLTYKEKKELFGGRVPNLQGFEYYVGGIFVMPGALESEINVQDLSEQPSLSNASPFADEFSWRNRHGQDWVTSVKNQGWCGSCWAFGAIGATELLVNLYYNKHLDLNLSEQDLLSCSNSGNCSGGSGILALDYLTTAGAVDEDCFSYWANDLPCYDKCPNPNECIKISGKNVFTNNPENELKKMLISGPICGRVNAWSHLMTLVGYKVIQRGDNIYVKDNTHDYWITVTDDNPIIGKTAWLFKNSWSSEWGDSGYVYLVTSINGLDGSILALGPVISLKLNDSDISCIDADNDGYYSWGIGPKPPHCPPCPDEPDGDDSDPCLGPMDEFGHIQLFTYLPIAKDTIISAGDPVPDLCAEGENIRWYSDNKGYNLLHTGNNFATGLIDPGIYTYYITQTMSGCESDLLPLTLTIFIEVESPVVDNVTVYLNQPIPTLVAIGENIQWYIDVKNPLFDSRDEQTYATAKIGNQLWMAENLRYYTPTGSWFYNNDSLSYAGAYGRLYDWKTALNSCPTNWKLPTDEEWIELEMYLGMSWNEANQMAWRGSGIGGKLKETGSSLWESPNTGASNEVNFNARPAGCYEDRFLGLRFFAKFYTSTDFNYDRAYSRYLLYSEDGIYRFDDPKSAGYSVRCVQRTTELPVIGNSLKPVYKLPGKYIYYVTQTISGFESQRDTVVITILPEISPPAADNITVCVNSQIPDLIAAGKNIKWYSDVSLSDLLHSGNSYTSGKTLPGEYTYYVTQSVDDCVSKADTVSLTINPLPAIFLGEDTTIFRNQDIIFGPFNIDNFYSWNDGSGYPYLDVAGNEIGLGYHTISVEVTDTNSCSFSDTINIAVLKCEVTNIMNAEACERYISPSGKIWSESGEYKDTIPNAQGCDSIITVNLTTVAVDTSVTCNQAMLTAMAASATYQWIDCNNGCAPISGEKQQSYSPGEDGHYAVIVSQNGCSDTSACFSFIKTGLVINTFKHNITIYPNPNDGSFTIDLGDMYPNVEITVTELDGRIIRKDNINNSRIIELQVSASSGIYLININTEYEKAVLKILKK